MSSVRAGAGRSTRSVTGAEADHDQSRLHWGGAVGKNLVRHFHAVEALDGICEVDPVRLEEFTQQYPEARIFSTPDEVFAAEDVSAVAIATPAGTHGALAAQALEAGKDVFAEKPLCLEVSEARSLVELAESRDRVLMVGHLLWYHPAVLKLRELIAEGRVGRVQYIYSNRLNLGKIMATDELVGHVSMSEPAALPGNAVSSRGSHRRGGAAVGSPQGSAAESGSRLCRAPTTRRPQPWRRAL